MRIARADELADHWQERILETRSSAPAIVSAALATAVADPAGAARILIRAADAVVERCTSAELHPNEGRPLLLLLWAVARHTSLDASAARRIILDAESLQPGRTLPILATTGGYVHARRLLDTISSLLRTSTRSSDPREQGLLLLRLQFLCASVNIPEFQRSTNLVDRALDDAGGALVPLLLHHADRIAPAPGPGDAALVQHLRHLVNSTADPNERALLHMRLACAIARRDTLDDALALELDPATDASTLARVRLDHLHQLALRDHRPASAARTAREQARACNDPTLRVAWVFRHLILLRQAAAPDEAIRGAARELQHAVERCPAPMPAMQAFTTEVCLAASLAIGDDDDAIALSSHPHVDPLIRRLLEATSTLASTATPLDPVATLLRDHADLGLPLLAALAVNRSAPTLLGDLRTHPDLPDPLHDLHAALELDHAEHPHVPPPGPEDRTHRIWLYAEASARGPSAAHSALALARNEPADPAARIEFVAAARCLAATAGATPQAAALEAGPELQRSTARADLARFPLDSAPEPEDSPFLRALDEGLEHLQQERWSEAAERFIDLTAEAPNDSARVRLLRLAGEARSLAGDFDQALDLYQAMLRIEGTHADLPEDLLELGRSTGRLAEILTILESRPHPLDDALLVQLEEAIDNADEGTAARILARIVVDLPEDEIPARIKAIAGRRPDGLLDRNTSDRLLIHWMRAPAGQQPALHHALRTLLARGAPLSVDPLLDFLASDRVRPERIDDVIALLDGKDTARQTVDLLLGALPGIESPEHVAAIASCAVQLMLGPARRPADAAPLLHHALTRAPRSPRLHLLAADIAEAEEAFENAAEALENAARNIAEPGQRATVYARLGELYEHRLDRPTLALEQYLVSFICDSGNQQSFANLARLYRRAGRPKDLLGVIDIAIQHIEEYGQGTLDLDDLLLQRAQLELEYLQDPEQAGRTLLRCAERNPDDPFFIDLMIQQVAPRLPDGSTLRRAVARFLGRNPEHDIPDTWLPWLSADEAPRTARTTGEE